jgi:hypothetical protein
MPHGISRTIVNLKHTEKNQPQIGRLINSLLATEAFANLHI